jgi:hypothetical protein
VSGAYFELRPLEIGDCGQRDHKRRIAKVDKIAAARASRELLPTFLAAIGQRGMSLADASRSLVGVPYSAISRWTGGNADLPPKYLEAVTEWVSK